MREGGGGLVSEYNEDNEDHFNPFIPDHGFSSLKKMFYFTKKYSMKTNPIRLIRCSRKLMQSLGMHWL
jgi:hypothetical protein